MGMGFAGFLRRFSVYPVKALVSILAIMLLGDTSIPGERKRGYHVTHPWIIGDSFSVFPLASKVTCRSADGSNSGQLSSPSSL